MKNRNTREEFERQIERLEKERLTDAMPPPWFADRVMASYIERQARPWRRFQRWLWTPLRLELERAYLFAVIMLVGAVIMGYFSSTPRSTSNRPEKSPVIMAAPIELRLKAPGAKRVTVAGDFNHWSSEGLAMVPTGQGQWVVRLRLAPGVYQYNFVIDGHEWIPDPNALQNVSDGFGRVNSILKL